MIGVLLAVMLIVGGVAAFVFRDRLPLPGRTGGGSSGGTPGISNEGYDSQSIGAPATPRPASKQDHTDHTYEHVYPRGGQPGINTPAQFGNATWLENTGSSVS